VAAAGTALWPLARRLSAAPRVGTTQLADAAVSPTLVAALVKSPYVYVSPLRANGEESSCHGEVWFAWLDGAVVLTSATTTWKARALERKLDQARIWVGDHGRWKALVGHNEEFRKAPSFVARASVVKGDTALLDRLLAEFEKKYPAEIGRWRDPMRAGNADGSRVMLRYVPEAAART
jgi:hypothetical protein